MRSYQKTDQEKQEMLEAENRDRRKTGFDLMPTRDKGAGFVHNELGNPVLIEWHIAPEKKIEGVPYPHIPPTHFKLTINGQSALMDADEFRKSFRWV